MTVEELLRELKKLNINLSAKEICAIWGMSEENFSRAKTCGRQIKHKHIAKLEDIFNILL